MPIFGSGPDYQTPLTMLPPIGALVHIGPDWRHTRPYRRVVGGFVSARAGGKDPTIRRAFYRRERKRQARLKRRDAYISKLAGFPCRMESMR